MLFGKPSQFWQSCFPHHLSDYDMLALEMFLNVLEHFFKLFVALAGSVNSCKIFLQSISELKKITFIAKL